MSSGVRISMPERTSPSGMFGVRTVAMGSRYSFRAPTASSEISFAPLVATMTGSTTMFSALNSLSFFAMLSMIPADATMPIFTASGRMSVKTLVISCSINSGETSKIPCTPVVFWAVRAVMALMPYTPFAIMVFRSAWIPAPPLESLPAIVNAVFIFSPFVTTALRFVPAPSFRRKPPDYTVRETTGGGAPNLPPMQKSGDAMQASPLDCSPRYVQKVLCTYV